MKLHFILVAAGVLMVQKCMAPIGWKRGHARMKTSTCYPDCYAHQELHKSSHSIPKTVCLWLRMAFCTCLCLSRSMACWRSNAMYMYVFCRHVRFFSTCKDADGDANQDHLTIRILWAFEQALTKPLGWPAPGFGYRSKCSIVPPSRQLCCSPVKHVTSAKWEP